MPLHPRSGLLSGLRRRLAPAWLAAALLATGPAQAMTLDMLLRLPLERLLQLQFSRDARAAGGWERPPRAPEARHAR